MSEAAVNSNMYSVIPNNFPAAAIENYQVDLQNLPSNITTGAWRAPYTNFLASAEQSFLDEIAEILQKDSVQIRLELLEKAKATYAKHEQLEAEIKDEEKLAEAKKGLLPKGSYEPDRFIGVIKLAAEKAGWDNAPDGVHLGFSVYYSHNTYVAEVAHLRMNGKTPKVEKITCAVDCGLVVNPIAARNLVEGGVIDGVGHSMFGEFVFENGQSTVTNFNGYRLIRTTEAPKVEVFFVDSDVDPTGLGEPTLPPAGAAVANAIYRATGKRLYKQPYIKETALLG
ncbi:MAG: molybdopterin cofactor-binding domain-containing protein [Bacteroidota bacterium]